MMRDIKIQFTRAKHALRILADKTADKMISTIDASRRHEQRTWGSPIHLSDAIRVYTEKNGYGVGWITLMDLVAPYWHLVNWGGSATWSGSYHFVPGYFQGNKFMYNPMQTTGWWLPSGMSGVMPAMNFVEKTRAWVGSVFRIHFNAQMKKYTIFTR